MSSSKDENRILQYLPFFGSIIIFFGVLRLSAYYNHFGIHIINFLDFSEIITSFLDIAIFSIIILIYTIVNSNLTNLNEVLGKPEKGEMWEKVFNHENGITRYIAYLRFHWVRIIIITCTAILAVLYYNYKSERNIVIILFITTFLFFFFSLVSLEFEYQNRKQKRSKTSIFFYNSLRYFIVGVTLVLAYSFYEVDQVANHNKYEGTVIKLKNGTTIISNSAEYYIGNTSKFLFIYNTVGNSTDIYSMNDLEKLTFKSQTDLKKLND